MLRTSCYGKGNLYQTYSRLEQTLNLYDSRIFSLLYTLNHDINFTKFSTFFNRESWTLRSFRADSLRCFGRVCRDEGRLPEDTKGRRMRHTFAWNVQTARVRICSIRNRELIGVIIYQMEKGMQNKIKIHSSFLLTYYIFLEYRFLALIDKQLCD